MDSPTLLLAATIAAAAAFAFWLERRVVWASKVGASLLVILFGALLSNLGLVPLRSPVYDAIFGPVTSLAIAWLLLAVDLKDLRRAGPRMLAAFGIAVGATVLGALAAFAVLGSLLDPTLRGELWKLTGVLAGTYSGGSLNFVSVGRAVELSEGLFAAATAADNVTTALWMGATLMLPGWLARFDPAGSRAAGAAPSETVEKRPAEFPPPVSLRVLDLSVLLALGLALLTAADAISRYLPGVPSVIWLTSLTFAVAQVPFVRRLRGAIHLGILALTLFFVVIGISSRFSEILKVGLVVFWITLLVVLVHGVVTFVTCRLLRIDFDTASIASQAAVGGPSTAMALAVARRRPELALPGVLVGLLGYAVGTYAGLAVAYLLR